MNWKFWQKNTADTTGTPVKKEAKPKDLPQAMGRYLVVDLNLDPDWAWGLKMVTREREKGLLEFRLFDPAACSVKVTGFSTLDDHPDLTLYEGLWFKNGKIKEIRDLRAPHENGTAA